jgi:hypothetical protein
MQVQSGFGWVLEFDPTRPTFFHHIQPVSPIAAIHLIECNHIPN